VQFVLKVSIDVQINLEVQQLQAAWWCKANYMSQVDVAPPGSNVQPVNVSSLQQPAWGVGPVFSCALIAWREDGKDFQILLVS